MTQSNKMFRSAVRIGMQQTRIEDAEDGGCGADSESQGNQSGQREAWILEKLAERVAKILEQSSHDGTLAM